MSTSQTREEHKRQTVLVRVTWVLAILLAACARADRSQPPAPSAPLEGTEWVLVSLRGNAPIEGKAITLRFGEASIEGSGGCNTYGGNYTAGEESLRLSDLYWTEMACMEPEGIMAQEQAYLQTLNAAARYRIVQDQGGGDRLEVSDEAGAQILAFLASTSAAFAEEGMPASTTPGFSLDCTLDADETYPAGEPVRLRFALHNRTDGPLYVLAWYTPLEGMAGEMLQVTRDGEKLPYQGMLAKREDPAREAYVAIAPGEGTSAEVDLRMGYDLSVPGSYEVQFTTGLQDVTDDGSLVPRKRDDHQPQPLSCNTVLFSIVAAPEPPAGFTRHVDTTSGVAIWVPESWTVIEPGAHGGSTILQSYPQEKYVGGEGFQPGDTKCDLTVHPPGVDVADVVPRNRTDPPVTVVSEDEIVLRSGPPGKRYEVESMGRSLSLVTEINGRAVVLTCFGELGPFDEIAVTLGAMQ
jgi:heat shock protein HslJ